MKTVPGVFRDVALVVGIICCLIIFACSHLTTTAGGADNRHNVVIGTYYIEIPGTAISEEDQKALNAKLAHAKEHLFKVHQFKDGELEKMKGKIQEISLDNQRVVKASENAKATRLTGWAIQIGDPYFEGYAPDGTHRNAMGMATGGSHRTLNTAEDGGNATGGSHRTMASPTPNGSHRRFDGHAPGGAHRNINKEDAAALVKELEPILQKYKAP